MRIPKNPSFGSFITADFNLKIELKIRKSSRIQYNPQESLRIPKNPSFGSFITADFNLKIELNIRKSLRILKNPRESLRILENPWESFYLIIYYSWFEPILLGFNLKVALNAENSQESLWESQWAGL